MLPVFQHRCDEAVDSQVIDNTNNSRWTGPIGNLGLPQSISHLYLAYGRSLKPEIMENDAFYSLGEIFKFAIASENQFLNLMEAKTKAASVVRPDAQISELQMTKSLIEEHQQGIRQNLETVRKRGSPKWPTAKEKGMQEKAERAAGRLERDFEHLLDRCRLLSSQCADGITILMNAESYRQSQRAIQQAEELAKLTFIAFFFVPLSFSTSFFGMQFDELHRPLSIWIWFTVSIPLLVFSFIFWSFDVIKILKRCWAFLISIVRRSALAVARAFC
jgi:Mg2+ and Co2+ transporter CorA